MLDDEKKDSVNEVESTTPEVTEEAKVEVKQDQKAEVKVSTPAAPKAKEDGKEDEGEDPILELPEDPAVTGPGHSDYNWSVTQANTSNYTESEIENYLKDYESALSLVEQSEIVTGIVTNIQDGDVILDIQYKSDGLIPISEFRDMPDLAVGDPVDVYVEEQEDDRGQLVLSRRKAKLLKAWDDLVDSYNNGTIVKGTIVSKTKGGLIADCAGLETFLPGSQIDIKPIIDYDAYVGKTMEFKVVKINEVIKNAVVSHKALIESDLAEQRDAIIQKLEKGQVLEGVVKNITDFGAFLDLGGVDGLLYITDISWGRINHPSEILALHEKINVVVLEFDENKKRISLGLKQLQPHPWEVLPTDIVAQSTVKGKIVNIEDYGAFLEISPGVEGLIHVSEVTWSNQPINAREFFKLEQEYEAKVVTIDREDRKMSLSVKQLTPDPWNEIQQKFAVGTKHTGVVKNLTPYGVFVELEEGIGGMVHISDLSWTKRYSHPSEFTAVGKDIDITILEIDGESRKLSLGHKQLEENPWDTFDSVFPVGSYHEATVMKRDDRRAIMLLPYGLEAYSPIKHMKKEDGKTAELDEVLTVKVIEFNRDDKRIMVSHSRYLEDISKEADDTVSNTSASADDIASAPKEQRKETRKPRKPTMKKAPNVERTTLGDMAAFSALQEQLDENKKAAVEPVAAKKEEE